MFLCLFEGHSKYYWVTSNTCVTPLSSTLIYYFLQSMDSFGGGSFGGGGYMQDGGGFGSPTTDSQEKKVSSLCFQEIKHSLNSSPIDELGNWCLKD